MTVPDPQIRKTLGAGAPAMGGLDAISLTGGIGENAAGLRATACAGLDFLGVSLDSEANENGSGDRVISTASSSVKVVVLSTNEELIVARRAYRCLT
ncbi:MAG: hypothetical protein GY953_51695 [bacterium]|nr:hypothetical protein [bacterium]